MKVKFVRNTFYDGEVCAKGRVVEMTEFEAGWYINTGKVVAHSEEETPDNRAVGLEASDEPKLTTRRTYKRRGKNGG